MTKPDPGSSNPPKAAVKKPAPTKTTKDVKKAPAKPSKPAAATLRPTIVVQDTAIPARLRNRHRVVFLSFIFVVLLPVAITGWYLSERATNQYHSFLSFSVRKEQSNTALDVIGGLSQLSGGSSSDADILYQYIQSQELIDQIDKDLDLRTLYSAFYQTDPLFSLVPNPTIEELIEYWPRVVRINFDRSTGILQLRILAFDPKMAQLIATKILDHSTAQINRLSAIAREDVMRYSRLELGISIDRLTAARQALTEFRLRTRIVDPNADLQGQMGLLNTMQAELVTTLIDLALLRNTASSTDPRIAQASRRADVIRAQIVEERAKFGAGGNGPGGEAYATLIADFERLKVDMEFAEETYKSALIALDSSLAKAQRQSRYIAAHIRPTLAESPEYPKRATLVGIAVAFLLVLWAIGILIFYSIRDRR